MAQGAETLPPIQIVDAGTSYELREIDSGRSLVLQEGEKQLPVGECDQQIVASERSPSSELIASVLIKNCGATTDFATHVTLGSPSGPNTAVAIFSGRPTVSVSWAGGSLEIVRPRLPAASVFLESGSQSGVRIAYAVSASDAGASNLQAVEFSSFNFGAMGREAGLPAEVLLRWAGWSQMASGLHRRDWGTWSGDAPYGDDPAGSAAIRNGIEFYEKYKK